MRMRRKKNLEEKLAAFSNELITPISEDKNFNNAENYQNYIDIFIRKLKGYMP